MGRSSLGYGSSRTSQDSHGLYSSRQGMGYGGGVFGIDGYLRYSVSVEIIDLKGLSFFISWASGSYGGNDVGGMYSSSYGGDYMSRGSDVCA